MIVDDILIQETLKIKRSALDNFATFNNVAKHAKMPA